MPRIIFDTSKLGSCKTQTKTLIVTGMGNNGYWKVELSPGGNNVTPEQLEQIKTDPTFQGMLPAFEFEGKAELEQSLKAAAGSSESTETNSTSTESSTPTSVMGSLRPEEVETLKPYTLTEADPIIEATSDLTLLAKWRQADDRKGIMDAIDRRMATINAKSVQS